MAIYTAPGIIFAKATAANLEVAVTASGGVDGDITDRINPVTLAQGVITTTKANLTGTFSSVTSPNEINGNGTNFDPELVPGDRLYYLDGAVYKFIGTVSVVDSDTKVTLSAAPVNTPTLGDTLAKNTNIVTGVNTQFLTDYLPGDYLFYFDASGSPILVGRISTVSDAQLVLTAKSNVDVVNKKGGKVNVVINGSESFLIRIPAIPNGNAVYLPNWDSFRLTATPTSYNNDTVSSISTYSAPNNPAVIGTPSQAPFSITPTNVFPQLSNKIFYQTPSPDFPNYLFAVLNPFGDQADLNLIQNTMYQFQCSDSIDGILAGANTLVSTLLANGYSSNQFIAGAGGGGQQGVQQ